MTTTTNPAYYADKAGQQHEIPEDAIELRLAWLAADRDHTAACDALTQRDAALRADPEAAFDDAERATLVDKMVESRGLLQDLTNQIHEHPWRRTMDNWYLADQAVRAAAAKRLGQSETSPAQG